jgi:hypothetical protein
MAKQSDERSSLDIERREDSFVLKRECEGQKTELVLTEGEVLALARMLPSYVRELAAQRHRPEAGVYAWVAIPTSSFFAAMDTHAQVVLLKLKDDLETEFDFSFTPNDARIIAGALIKFAQLVDEAPKISRQ